VCSFSTSGFLTSGASRVQLTACSDLPLHSSMSRGSGAGADESGMEMVVDGCEVCPVRSAGQVCSSAAGAIQ
jgi:hypothetical protein